MPTPDIAATLDQLQAEADAKIVSITSNIATARNRSAEAHHIHDDYKRGHCCGGTRLASDCMDGVDAFKALLVLIAAAMVMADGLKAVETFEADNEMGQR